MDGVLVIGGINLDIKAKTLGPHVAATSNPALISSKPGGVGRNIAHNLAVLGVPTRLLSVIGNDAHGETVLAATKVMGVDVSPVIKLEGPTGVYLAVLDTSGELVTAASDMAALEELTPAVIAKHAESLAASRYIVADCNLRLDTLDAIASMAGGKMIVEPVSVSKSQKLTALLEAHEIFLATPNLDQMIALTGKSDPLAAAQALQRAGLLSLIIHHGAKGAYAFDGSVMHHVPSQARGIVDVTGAGDAATAGLVAGLMQNLSLAEAAALGQRAAAQVIASEFSTLVGP
ncbi:carbohydrate kinase family protein [Aestuariivirga litoralis]|uniref:carbohydrate kinase family protein n=1 Tax=Aestuariivirga litoralis TaxID=2650924 RepID=UPI0018C6C9C5|nr:carbohydrate kinase family protein [Aestuariivirga litoralis]MBG1231920.1 carbohydrate kinase [Aestuariivirga litoralis]